jgi:hypothetical protein
VHLAAEPGAAGVQAAVLEAAQVLVHRVVAESTAAAPKVAAGIMALVMAVATVRPTAKTTIGVDYVHSFSAAGAQVHLLT